MNDYGNTLLDCKTCEVKRQLDEAVRLLDDWVNGEGEEPVKTTRNFLTRTEGE
jgi:hypothetical protein